MTLGCTSSQNVNKSIKKYINQLHLLLFNRPIGNEMEGFLNNLSWSFFGGMSASIIGMVSSIFIARHLSLDQLGKYNSIVSLSTAVSSIILFGSHLSGMRYACSPKYSSIKSKLISSSFLVTIFNSLAITSIFVSISPFISSLQDILPNSMILANLISFKLLFDMILRTFGDLSRQSLLRIFDSFIAITINIFLIYLFKQNVYSSPYLAITLGSCAFIAFGFLSSKGIFSRPNLNSIKLIFNYNKNLFFSVIGSFLISSEGMLIGRYMGLDSLGAYGILSIGNFTILSTIGSIFINAYSPAIIKNEQHISSILQKTLKALFWGILFWVPTGIIISLFITLLSKQDIHFLLPKVTILTINSYTVFIFSVLNNIFQIINTKKSSLISLLCYLSVITSIAILKNLDFYLVSQGIIYTIFSLILYQSIVVNANQKNL